MHLTAITNAYIIFWYIKHKTLNTDIWNYLNSKRYFECEIKTSSRWQQVSVNKWVVVIEPNHLNDWFIRERITETLNSAVAVFGVNFVVELKQKQEIWHLNRKFLN